MGDYMAIGKQYSMSGEEVLWEITWQLASNTQYITTYAVNLYHTYKTLHGVVKL